MSFAKKSLLVLFSLAFCFMLLELFVRVFGNESIQPRFVIDSGFGVRTTKPKIDTAHISPGEYRIRIRTNSVGMRGTQEYTLQKPKDTFRIAMLGDSFLYGYGVEDSQVVSHVLEKMLNKKFDKKFEVLNFGVSGFGTAEEFVTYSNNVAGYSPDLVILFYFNNDLGNNVISGLFELDCKNNLVRTGRKFVPGVKVREVLYSISPIRWLLENSHFLNLIRNRLSKLIHQHFLRRSGLKSYSEKTESNLRLTEEILLLFLRTIRHDGAKAGIFVIPNKEMETNFPFDNSDIYSSSLFVMDGRELLHRGDYWTVDGHWKDTGHRKIAVAVLNAIGQSELIAGIPDSNGK